MECRLTTFSEGIDDELADIISRAKEKASAVNLVRFPAGEPEVDPPEVVYRRAGIPAKLMAASFDNFEGKPALVKCLRELSATDKSILLRGPVGCGKTHLATAILKDHLDRDIPGRMITAPELLLNIRESYRGNGMSESHLIDVYSAAGLLVLDDLGAEKSTEWTIATFYIILDRRNRMNRKTVITTNLDPDGIEGALGDRIASRISEMVNIEINMPDYRKKRATKGGDAPGLANKK